MTAAVCLLCAGLAGYLIAWLWIELEPRRLARRADEHEWVAWARALVDPEQRWNL